MLSQEVVAKFLKTGEHPVIISLLPFLLERSSQLSTEQHVGILIACLIFGGVYWNSAVSLIKAMNATNREKTLEIFKFFTAKIYGDDSALWLS
jgi:hypothetical protein